MRSAQFSFLTRFWKRGGILSKLYRLFCMKEQTLSVLLFVGNQQQQLMIAGMKGKDADLLCFADRFGEKRPTALGPFKHPPNALLGMGSRVLREKGSLLLIISLQGLIRQLLYGKRKHRCRFMSRNRNAVRLWIQAKQPKNRGFHISRQCP